MLFLKLLCMLVWLSRSCEIFLVYRLTESEIIVSSFSILSVKSLSEWFFGSLSNLWITKKIVEFHQKFCFKRNKRKERVATIFIKTLLMIMSREVCKEQPLLTTWKTLISLLVSDLFSTNSILLPNRLRLSGTTGPTWVHSFLSLSLSLYNSSFLFSNAFFLCEWE